MDFFNKKENEEYPGTRTSSLVPESCPQALLSEHACKERLRGHGLLGEILWRRGKWFNHGYKGDSQNETSGAQRKQIITNSGSSLESREPSAAIFWPVPLVQSPGLCIKMSNPSATHTCAAEVICSSKWRLFFKQPSLSKRIKSRQISVNTLSPDGNVGTSQNDSQYDCW